MTEELNTDVKKLRFLDEKGALYPKWEEKKLGEVGETFNGLTGKSGSDFSETKTEGMQPYVSYVDVYSQNRVPLPSNYVKINENEKNNPVKKNDIFFTTSSETKEETGLASLMAYEPTEKTYLNSFCFGFRTCVEGNSLYLMNTMRYGNLRKKINVLAQGSTRYNISKTKLMKETINLPSLPEQEKIADFLSNLDERIEAQSKLVELLKEQKQGYSQKIFNGSLRFKKDDGTDYDDWEEKKLGEVSNLKNGYAFKSSDYSTNGKYKVITIKNVSGSTYVDSNNVSYIKEKPKDLAPHQFLNINDILVSLTGNVGRISVVNKENLLLNQRVGLIETNKDLVNNLFLSIILSFNRFENTMIKNSQGGAQKNISKGDIEMYEVNLPSLPEQEKIAAFLSSLDNRIDQQLNKLEQLKQEKQAYMQRTLG